MQSRLQFVCPVCDCRVLEERLYPAIKLVTVQGFVKNKYETLCTYAVRSPEYQSRYEDFDDMDIQGYTCQECGFEVGEDIDSAVTWLTNNNMLIAE